jgi:hypothetical protein
MAYGVGKDYAHGERMDPPEYPEEEEPVEDNMEDIEDYNILWIGEEEKHDDR